jgi:uncharacterized protein YndB with AHSA1/START domain
MSTETVLVSEVIFATRERLYDAWLDSEEHSAFTADTAEIEPVIGGRHSTFSGYASGQNLALEPYRRIIQSWRTTDFPEGTPDSRLEITFEDTLGGTLVTLLHTGIPTGQSDRCRDGWLKYYFAPMKSYFGKESPPEAAPDLDPGALSPTPARKISKPKPKPKARAKAKAKAKPKAKPKAKAKAKPKAKPKAKAKPKRQARKSSAGKKPKRAARPMKRAKKKKRS